MRVIKSRSMLLRVIRTEVEGQRSRLLRIIKSRSMFVSVILSEDKAVKGQRSRLLTVIMSRSKLLWGQRSRLLRVIRSRLFVSFWLIICKKEICCFQRVFSARCHAVYYKLDKAWVIQGCDLVLYHDG